MRFAFISLLLITSLAAALHAATLRGQVTSDDFPAGVPGVNVVLYRDSLSTGAGAATDSTGHFLVAFIPAGTYQLHFDFLGYATQIRTVSLEENSDVTLRVRLVSQAVQVPELAVTATLARHEVAVTSTPLRLEVVVPEELQDKIAFSASVNGALRYSGGIYINTSRNLYEAENIRLRGLDSRYLLLLNDQVPVLGFQPEEIGLWTLPLVGIKQVEIAKSDVSALYGLGNAGAIEAALRTPFSDTLKVFGLARSNFEDDHYAGLYAGNQWGKLGLSGVFSGERISADDSTLDRWVATPRLDYRSAAGAGFVSASLLGWRQSHAGSRLDRSAVSAGWEFHPAQHGRILLQGQYADQTLGYPPDADRIRAHSQLGYGAVQFIHESGSLTSLAGLDGYTEDWKLSGWTVPVRSRLAWGSVFLQEEWLAARSWSLLYGGRLTRLDLNASGPVAVALSSSETVASDSLWRRWETSQYLALLWKPGALLNFRLAGGSGSVLPSSHYLTRTGEPLAFFVPAGGAGPERFRSLSFDVKLTRRLFGLGWTGDLSFFLTQQRSHLDIYPETDSDLGPSLRLENRSGYALPGVEFFSRLDLGEDAAFLLGYTYLDPSSAYRQNPGTLLPLPRHQGNFELDWEIEPLGLRLELEGKALSSQPTPNDLYRSQAPAYAVLGATAEYALGKVKLFGGVENLSGFRQTDSGPLWGPRVGREAYVGVKGGF